jgi:hypothetical protein
MKGFGRAAIMDQPSFQLRQTFPPTMEISPMLKAGAVTNITRVVVFDGDQAARVSHVASVAPAAEGSSLIR